MSKIIGMDEVGYGPLAGPVVVAAVLIDDGAIAGVRDSKLVEEEQRYVLGDEIRRHAPWSVIVARGADAINDRKLGLCWRECVIEAALAAHEAHPDAAIMMDGVPPEKTLNQIREEAPFLMFVANGDDNVYQIGAASLVAKSYRDRLMIQYAKQYPAYDFAKHKGYGTSHHLKAIREHGECPLHRHRAVAKALYVGPGKKNAIIDPSQEVEHYLPPMAKEYIRRAQVAGLKGDFETKFIPDLAMKLDIQGDLSPRQKFFLKRIAEGAERRAQKVRK